MITGSSRGLGKEMALALAQRGANVIVNYLNNKVEAEGVVKQIEMLGSQARAIQADVSSSFDVQRLFRESLACFGPTDILINNAGTMYTGTLDEMSEETFDLQVRTNIKSVFLMMKFAPSYMNQNGRIINISSSTTKLNMPGYAIYSASKAAVEQMTRNFAAEVGGQGITVNAVSPGPLNTELFQQGKTQAQIDLIAKRSIYQRIGETGDIIPVIEFLCSEESKWITAQVIYANGGMV